ncbi:hypothetical protein B0T13DRAFT_488772 [Neurospora crassa]|nr:hypothetical protein B0T13DRAFT_488772 [Neurospora crassa]
MVRRHVTARAAPPRTHLRNFVTVGRSQKRLLHYPIYTAAQEVSTMKWLDKAGTSVLIAARFWVTLPYQHMFIYCTLRPAQEIQAVANLDIEVPENRTTLLKAVKTWRTGKWDELNRIIVGAFALTAIVTASLSWGSIQTSHWTGPALWYASLALCILGFGIGSQQQLLLGLLDEEKALDVDNPPDADSAKKVILRHLNQILALKRLTQQHLPPSTDVEAQAGATTQGSQSSSSKAGAVVPGVVGTATAAGGSPPPPPPPPQWVLSARRMFFWQCSIMVMSWSTGLYLIGLAIVVCTPILERRPWDAESHMTISLCQRTPTELFCNKWCGESKILQRGEILFSPGKIASKLETCRIRSPCNGQGIVKKRVGESWTSETEMEDKLRSGQHDYIFSFLVPNLRTDEPLGANPNRCTSLALD